MQSPRSSVHFKYWILILVAIIILLIAEKWSDSQLFTTYLSNAATLTSLLLGLVAIFYAYVSNESISTSLGRVEGISRNFEEIKSQIQAELIESNATVDRLSGFAETLSDLTSVLGQSISKLPRAIDSLKDESIELRQRVHSMDASLSILCDSFAEKTADKIPVGYPSQSHQGETKDATFARNLLDRSNLPLSAILATLSLYHKSAKNGAYSIRELAELCNAPSALVISFIGFLSGLGLLSLRFKDGDRRSSSPIEILHLNPVIANESTDHLLKLSEHSTPETGGLDYTSFIEEVEKALI